MAVRSCGSPCAGGYWLPRPSSMARIAASFTSCGPSVSGKPCPRFTEPVATASALISPNTVLWCSSMRGTRGGVRRLTTATLRVPEPRGRLIGMSTLVVTGGSRGIGAAVCVAAAAAGWDVVVDFARDESAAADVVRRITDAGAHALAVQADVRDAASVEALFAAADAWRGPVTGLVNNAGISGGLARVDEVGEPALRDVLAVNVVGPFLCAARRCAGCRRGTAAAAARS